MIATFGNVPAWSSEDLQFAAALRAVSWRVEFFVQPASVVYASVNGNHCFLKKTVNGSGDGSGDSQPVLFDEPLTIAAVQIG